MGNKHINGLAINHSLAPLLEQKGMRVLDVEGMDLSSKIDLRDVSWWMSIKDAYRPGVLVIARLSKERCIPLPAKEGHFTLDVNMIEIGVGFLQFKNILFQNGFIENSKARKQIWSHQNPTP
jgi:hypothetical protein